tara:strand:- start:604 stop:909 length:306 start_codon:yes stop_codon:yes gene_type:complete
MKFKHNWLIEEEEEIDDIFSGDNKVFHDLIVDIALANLKNNKKEIPIVSIKAKDVDITYQVTIERHDMLETLEINLEYMEDFEDYERCQKITEGIEYLKSK